MKCVCGYDENNRYNNTYGKFHICKTKLVVRKQDAEPYSNDLVTESPFYIRPKCGTLKVEL